MTKRGPTATLHAVCRLVDLVVKTSASRVEDPGSRHTSDSKNCTPMATLSGACIIGSALGLVGPVSVYCDWVR